MEIMTPRLSRRRALVAAAAAGLGLPAAATAAKYNAAPTGPHHNENVWNQGVLVKV